MVLPVTQGRDLGWPYCNPNPDLAIPAGSDANVPFTPDALTDPGGTDFDCAALAPIQVALAAHNAPLGLDFLEGSKLPAPWSSGAVVPSTAPGTASHPNRRPCCGWPGTPAPKRLSRRSPSWRASRTPMAVAGVAPLTRSPDPMAACM